MWQLGAKEQASVLLIVAVSLAGALVRTWRQDRDGAPPQQGTQIQSHGQDFVR
ncbi:MAG: hypothetical protein IT577_17430 [Verrucomicrobiae bacterium]|nr:hypothetical protein [Verrucomicrobiae bacterium]